MRSRINHGMAREWILILSIVFILLVAGSLSFFNAQEWVVRFLDWLASTGPWGPFFFILIHTMVVILLLPGIMFTMGAGFLFGVTMGAVYVVIATIIGATIAFLIARHLFGERTAHYLLNHPKLRIINDEFRDEGWKIILLTRLVPFFPFKLSNYFFGLTNFRLRDFVVGTLVGITPFTLTNVYLGSIAADLTTLGAHNAMRSKTNWFIYILGFFICIVTVIYISRHARIAMNRYLSRKARDAPEKSAHHAS